MQTPDTNALLETGLASVLTVDCVRPGAQELTVELRGERAKALNYTSLLGAIQPGEQVLVNTTAVRAGLGTGGVHFVMRRAAEGRRPKSKGHIVKLRYTPLQFRCTTVEEEASPFHKAVKATEDLGAMPVIAAALHSQIAPAAAALKGLIPETRLAYVMTDTAALPMAFSRLVPELKEAGMLDFTITVGQAFGGDFEAVNIYSALLAARAMEAEAVIVAQGPGNVGTNTEWGFGAIAQGEHVNAVGLLEGIPIAVPRISFADPRPRHRGVSRQSLLALGRVALVEALVGLPDMEPAKLELVRRQLDEEGITQKHEVLVARGDVGVQVLIDRGIEVKTMGRSMEEDPEFFLAAGAAGAIAAAKLAADQSASGA